ncbi:hypothetical protein ES703_43301 [subsurface metagenome]
MFNFFEQPYTLIGAAVLVLFAMLTFRSVLPEKRRWWQLLVPALVVTAAFGMDFAVRTDLEKINAVINTCIKAVEEEDCNAIEAIIAEDYRDSYHNTKRDLMRHCRTRLSQPLVEKNKKRACLVQLSPPNATATLFATIIFEKDSYVSVNYKAWLMVEARLSFQEQPDKTWLINRIEILEIDRQPASWSQIR